VGPGQLMSDDIGIDQRGSSLREKLGDRTLAAANTAGQTDNESHGVGSLRTLQALGLEAFGRRATMA
jgi:hypothetical protein